jgi:KDO2-lipid IV(A) lauroyltransferase
MRTDSNLSALRWHAGTLNNGLIFGATYYGVTHLPRAWSYGIGHVGTWLAYRLMRQGTAGLVHNFRMVRPYAGEQQLKELALLTYRSYARDTIDFIRSLTMTRAEFAPLMASFDSRPLDEVRERGRGAIVVGGHFGNWELGGVALRLMHGYPLTVVGKSEASPIVGEFRRRMRDSLSIDTLEIGQMLETALQIRRLLSGNGVVAMLLDRHIGRDRVDVTFFGRQTAFLRSPAMIAHLSGAPLLPAFMVRQPDGRFNGWFGDVIDVDATEGVDQGVQRATQAFASELERQIERTPQFWYQFYPYWQRDEGRRA